MDAQMTVHLKKFEQKLIGLVLDENDLVRIAHKIQDVAKKYEGHIEITITSSDDEDQLKSTDIQIFLKPDMIRRVKEIEMKYLHLDLSRVWEPIISIKILLVVPDPNDLFLDLFRPTKLEVYGSDTDVVTGTFRKLEREMFELLKLPYWIIDIIYSILFRIVIIIVFGFISGGMVFLTFDTFLDLLARAVDGFRGSTLDHILITVGWFCVFSASLLGGGVVMGLIMTLLPPVKFTGRLSDSNSDVRKFILLICGFVLLPIMINIISSIIVSK